MVDFKTEVAVNCYTLVSFLFLNGKWTLTDDFIVFMSASTSISSGSDKAGKITYGLFSD